MRAIRAAFLDWAGAEIASAWQDARIAVCGPGLHARSTTHASMIGHNECFADLRDRIRMPSQLTVHADDRS